MSPHPTPVGEGPQPALLLSLVGGGGHGPEWYRILGMTASVRERVSEQTRGGRALRVLTLTYSSVLSEAHCHEMHTCASHHMRDSSLGPARSSSNFSEPPQMGPCNNGAHLCSRPRPQPGRLLPPCPALGHLSALAPPLPQCLSILQDPLPGLNPCLPPARFPVTSKLPLCFRHPDYCLRLV